MLDFTSYLDILPNERPAEATTYWKGRGYNIARQEAKLRATGWKPTLHVADTGSGAYAGKSLTAGYDLAVHRSFGYKGMSLLKITNAATGQPIGGPIGNANGIFRVGDTGGGSLRSRNALDFYCGNNRAMMNYFEGLNNKGVKIKVQVVQ